MQSHWHDELTQALLQPGLLPWQHPRWPEWIARDVQHALSEDGAAQDWTAALIAQAQISQAGIWLREPAVVCGQPWADAAFRHMEADLDVQWLVREGQAAPAGTLICRLTGSARALLTAERTALNFLQTLSAVATLTQSYVQAVTGTRAKILDTRKTLPGLRLAQKYAVQCAGGHNQRLGLYDGVLIKENHIMAAGSIAAAVASARAQVPSQVSLQVEVETLDELKQALDCQVALILLDNMDLPTLAAAVDYTADRAELEASGGVSLQSVAAIAATGVHRISVGRLTKDVQAVDYSMRFLSHA